MQVRPDDVERGLFGAHESLHAGFVRAFSHGFPVFVIGLKCLFARELAVRVRRAVPFCGDEGNMFPLAFADHLLKHADATYPGAVYPRSSDVVEVENTRQSGAGLLKQI